MCCYQKLEDVKIIWKKIFILIPLYLWLRYTYKIDSEKYISSCQIFRYLTYMK